ncbi:hypothetical protein [Streptomyces albireticuli]|uniref:Uncharacterized protein n=1 Tax=Streptomyces albireticuli TaxID=1940 RepID=A0A2A2CYL5_9ACTN|nr:hypothetical protein [Streptomyces albireticuli]MCD9142674.1 hypothetical protein [Streptomyces albireticuli]MCD9163007.1 hypothetical protein [Streptomyces albireticuli]MCD9192802.1 hypothetical protein [Streptomyces albireticuli]PAU44259.1 hypothetical protein CK936_35735 [Streptomyces albireticuli]
MPLAIAVTSLDLVISPPDGQAPDAAVFQPPEAQPLDTAVTQTAVLLERCGHVVALYPDSLPVPYVRRLHTIRSVLETDRLALLPVALPPLAVAVLARQLRQLSLSDLSPGVLASAARLLAHYVYAGAQLPGVGGLDRVDVGLGAHLASLVPGSRFGVLVNPARRLFRVGGGGEVPAGPGFGTRLTVARARPAKGDDWVLGTLAPHWRVQGVQEAPLPAESGRWWGSRGVVEFAAAIADPTVLYQLVSSVRREQCHWCGLELIGDRCAFCAGPLPRADGTGDPGAGPGTGRTAGARTALAGPPGRARTALAGR